MLLAMACEVGAASLTSNVFVRADIVYRTQFASFVSAAGVHQDHLDASRNRVLDRRIFGFRYPIRDDQTVNFLADCGADQLYNVRREVVVVLQAQIVDGTAISDNGRSGVIDTLFDQVPEGVIVRAAYYGNCCRVCRRCSRCHQCDNSRSFHQVLHKSHVSLLPVFAIWRI